MVDVGEYCVRQNLETRPNYRLITPSESGRITRFFPYDVVGVGDGRATSLLVSYETWTVNGLPGMSSVPQRMTSVWSPFSGAVYDTW